MTRATRTVGGSTATLPRRTLLYLPALRRSRCGSLCVAAQPKPAATRAPAYTQATTGATSGKRRSTQRRRRRITAILVMSASSIWSRPVGTAQYDMEPRAVADHGEVVDTRGSRAAQMIGPFEVHHPGTSSKPRPREATTTPAPEALLIPPSPVLLLRKSGTSSADGQAAMPLTAS